MLPYVWWPSVANPSTSCEITTVDNEGLRLGMFFGGLLMAVVPVTFGIAGRMFRFKKFRVER